MDQPTVLTSTSPGRAPIGFGEFVALSASMMALTALGIDSMLPALPAIGNALGVIEENHRQYVITSYLLGFAIAHLFYGPFADRYGRRPVLLVSLAAYFITCLVAAASESFALLLASRAAMGMAAAGARVVTVAMVRDCYAGRGMARVMSLVAIVFMAAPILAPTFGQGILLIGSWRLIFWGVGLAGGAVALWFWLRMPETLPAEARQSLSPGRIVRDYALAARDRCAVGYTLAIALLSGGLFGFIGSVQQIVSEVFGAGSYLVLVFACIASTMAVGSFLNARIVMRLGMRPISHTALATLIALAAIHLAIAWSGLETIWTFIGLQALMMGCFGLATANFSAMAMERMGAIAGTASSLQGFTSTLGGALIGAAIGQAFDGSTIPLYAGFLTVSLTALIVIAVTERGRLFQPS